MLAQGKEDFFMRKSVRALTLAAMLTAMSVVIGIFCKSFLNFGGGLIRITFENLPIILSGILFGPLVGAVVGVATDLISYFLSPQIYPPNFIVMFGAAMIGFLSGLVSKVIIRKRGYAQIIVAVVSAHVVGSMIIKTIGLFQFFQWAVVWRIPLYIVIAAVEMMVLCLLYKNATFRKLIERTDTPSRKNGEKQ
jgi:ECF transporter S component (folate family)